MDFRENGIVDCQGVGRCILDCQSNAVDADGRHVGSSFESIGLLSKMSPSDRLGCRELQYRKSNQLSFGIVGRVCG